MNYNVTLKTKNGLEFKRINDIGWYPLNQNSHELILDLHRFLKEATLISTYGDFNSYMLALQNFINLETVIINLDDLERDNLVLLVSSNVTNIDEYFNSDKISRIEIFN